MATGSFASEVEAEIRGRLGIITLNRSKALNALNLAMVEQLDTILAAWAVDPAVDAVLIRSASERAFCAGGDVRSIGILPDPSERMSLGRAFFSAEYRVNWRINTLPKPFIALMSGIAMGGGLGISVHGSHRIGSETLRLAMPETLLGLFPDIGATWFLTRCPGSIGRYLALTGVSIGAADALAAGLATQHVPASEFAALTADLSSAPKLDGALVDTTVARYATPAEGGPIPERAAEIDRLFGADDLDTVLARVGGASSTAEWIEEADAALRRASPTSLRVTWRRMVEGRDRSIDQILEDDFRVAVRMVGRHDFAEGVRAILVDKDGAPRWDPTSPAEVAEAAAALLAPPDRLLGMRDRALTNLSLRLSREL
jgi:enoyl-CoA hydratase